MARLKEENSRKHILENIRKGLAKASLPMPFPQELEKPLTSLFAYHGLSAEETFAEEFIKLGGKFVFCEDEQEAIANLIALCDNESWKDVVCADVHWLQVFSDNKLDFIQPAHKSKEHAEACITTCDYLIARTGSMVLSSTLPMGRTAPVFYPVHIVIAYASQLKEDITPALEALISQDKMPSMVNINTGPSRTADIEKTLVVGVHGPKEVYCFFINK